MAAARPVDLTLKGGEWDAAGQRRCRPNGLAIGQLEASNRLAYEVRRGLTTEQPSVHEQMIVLRRLPFSVVKVADVA